MEEENINKNASTDNNIKSLKSENQILSIQSIKPKMFANRAIALFLSVVSVFSLVPVEAISNITDTTTRTDDTAYIDVLLGADALSTEGTIQLTDEQIAAYTYTTDNSVANLIGATVTANTENTTIDTSTEESTSKVESTEENTSTAITTVSNTEESTKEAAEEDTEENTSTVVVSELNAEPSILSAQTGVKVDVTGTDIRDIINIGTETSGKDPTDVDLSEEQGVRDAFVNWYEANLKQEFTTINKTTIQGDFDNAGVGLIYDGNNVWGIATSDEFLPSVVKIYEKGSSKYYLAWLFESMSGCGTEYKASDDEYYEKLSRGNQGIDLYALGGQFYYFPGFGTSTAQSNWHTVDIDNSHYNLILNDGHQYLAGNPDHPEWPGIGIPVSGWKIDEIHGLMYHYDMNGDGVFDENDITDINGDGTLDEYEQEGIGLSPWYACWQVSLIKDNIVATSGVAADWYKTYGSVSLKEYEPSATSPDGVKGYDDTGKYIDELKYTAQRVIRNENGEETDEQYQYRIYNTKRKTYSWYGNLRGRNNAGLSNYVTGQSDMYNAKRTHLGAKIVLWNVDEQDWHYYIPRFVWNKYGGTITSSGFPRDTAYKASEIANPLGGLYEASRIYYGRPWYWNSTVKAGTVNKDWLEKWDTSSLTDLVTKASKDGQECFIYSKLPGQGDKEYKILNRNHPEAAKLLSLLITMEVVYGASEKNEYWYDLETTDPNSKRAHEYRSINYSDDGMVSSGWDEFIKTAKAKSKFSKAGPKYYYGTCTAEDLAKCATEEEKNMLMDAYLSCNAFIFLNLAAVTGYPGDLFHSNGYVEGSNYIKFTMCNESKYYKSGGCGKITYVKQELSGVTPVSITRDTVLSGAENIESGESVLDEEYYKTGLWKLKDDESIDGQIQSLLGVSRESWHELSETGDYYGETPSHLSSIYDKLNSLSKEDFESIFEFVDPEATAYEMSGGRIR